MTASRARHGAAALVGALLLLAGDRGASAQSAIQAPAAPPAAAPGASPAPTASQAPAALSPPRALRPVAPSTEPPPPPGTGRKEPGVEVNALARIDPETVGTLRAETGDLGPNLWQGVDRAYVTAMLDNLPVRAPSPTMRDLMRRLLLTSAQPPQRAEALPEPAKPRAEDAPPTKPEESLIARRVRLLAAMGDVSGVGDLLAAIPGNVTDPGLVQVEANARFLANDNARACGLASQQVASHDAAYWQKAMVFCQILAGQPSQADLGISMLNEMGQKAPAFYALADRLLGGTSGELKSVADADGLLMAMARAAKVALPEDAAKSDRPGVLRAVAVNPNVPAKTRLEAAERAEAAGALETEALRQLYASVAFDPADLNEPLTRAQAMGGPLARALLYHAALAQSVPTAQAEIISQALKLAVSEGRYGAAARVFQPMVAKIQPEAALLWFAPDVVRLMLSTNDPEGAKNWFRLLQAAALFNDDSRALLVRLTPLVRLVGTMGLEKEPRDLNAWWQAVAREPAAARRAALLYGLLDGLGEEIPLDTWRGLGAQVAAGTETAVSPVLWFRLLAVTQSVEDWIARGEAQAAAEAAKEGPASGPQDVQIAAATADAPPPPAGEGDALPPHRGEVILTALVMLGNGGAAQASAPVLRQVTSSLRAIGLDAEARALALEAALASGL